MESVKGRSLSDMCWELRVRTMVWDFVCHFLFYFVDFILCLFSPRPFPCSPVSLQLITLCVFQSVFFLRDSLVCLCFLSVSDPVFFWCFTCLCPRVILVSAWFSFLLLDFMFCCQLFCMAFIASILDSYLAFDHITLCLSWYFAFESFCVKPNSRSMINKTCLFAYKTGVS